MLSDGPAQVAGHFQFRSGDSYRIRINRGGYIAVLTSSRIFTGIAALSLAATAACTTDPQTGQKRMSKAGIGALAGAALGTGAGAIVGGKRNRTEMIVGAGIGALAGAGIGTYMDKQEKELREKTAGTDVQVIRQGDELLLNMPSGLTFDTNRTRKSTS